MRYQDIKKGSRYGARLVLTIQPEESDGAGPGLLQPGKATDEVAYQDFAKGVRTRCTAAQFARRATKEHHDA